MAEKPAHNMICKNCSNHFEGNYCNRCGEKVYTNSDKSIVHLLEEAVHFISHFEGTFVTSLKAIFKTPGRLSRDYCDGIRKRYYKPLTLFLVLVIIYLLFPTFSGLNMPMNNYAGEGIIGRYAASKIHQLLQTRHLSPTELAILFHERSEKVSKFLLLVFIPCCALLTFLVYRKKHTYFFDHIVFAAESNSFFLIWGFFVMPLLYGLVYWVMHWSVAPSGTELALIIFVYLGMFGWLRRAVRRFFNVGTGRAILFAVLFCPFHFFVLQVVYKPLLFYFTIVQL